ncbi:Hsp20/alpha crystallin family protein [Variovorax saccharolyticus]|uniref:Hsp20/alpha crystallin family protein n=1 Tax=Variovorax saccharolyticus TaxID=3053516 RepID=UPI00257916BE|nr:MULTISPECIES: Hsp20/alpha crystallin family protein [unclassified Variovorax]MDM0022318.1 Hsp20/alpha crystallin family protein [Variovorax sp. J22R187]MDM0028873.1 Hsp20/alpha crystallin family protein [Variovorax sp. J31P216]
MPRDPTAMMWLQACELLERADGLQRQFFRLTTSQRQTAVWEPPVDVIEDPDEIVFVVAMPGVSAGRIQVVNDAGALLVRGVRPFPVVSSNHTVRQLEIPYGVFERRITLPLGRLELGTPQLVEGCLVLTVRKLGRER